MWAAGRGEPSGEWAHDAPAEDPSTHDARSWAHGARACRRPTQDQQLLPSTRMEASWFGEYEDSGVLGAWTTSSEDLAAPCHGDGLRVQTRFRPSVLLVSRVFYYEAEMEDPFTCERAPFQHRAGPLDGGWERDARRVAVVVVMVVVCVGGLAGGSDWETSGRQGFIRLDCRIVL
jgi:hypothetical protein